MVIQKVRYLYLQKGKIDTETKGSGYKILKVNCSDNEETNVHTDS